jgi:hypothetical protein
MKNSEYMTLERELKKQKMDDLYTDFYTAFLFLLIALFFFMGATYTCPSLKDVPIVKISSMLLGLDVIFLLIKTIMTVTSYYPKFKKLDKLWEEKVDYESAIEQLKMLPEKK